MMDAFVEALGFDSREALWDASEIFAEEGDVSWYITALPDGRWAAWDDAEIDLGRVQFFASRSDARAEQEAGWRISHPSVAEPDATTYAQRALVTLNAIPETCPDWWDEYVYPLAGYDPEATEAADPNGNSTVIVFSDASRCKWDGDSKTWEVDRPEPPNWQYPSI